MSTQILSDPMIELLFWPRVDMGGDCWLWTGGKQNQGYGIFWLDGNRPVRAHRVSYEFTKGPIPEGMCVLHSCDNPPCVNPDHLFLGTYQDNAVDAVRKLRLARGRTNALIKLSDDQVLEIRRLCGEGCSRSEVGRMFGVARTTVNDIVWRRNWKHI